MFVVGDSEAKDITRVAPINITPVHSMGPHLSTDALIVKSLTEYKPSFNYPARPWAHLTDLTFTNGDPDHRTPIQLIIGADLYAYILCDGLRKGKIGKPTTQNTIFGWVLFGPTSVKEEPRLSLHVHHTRADLGDLLQKFWELEEFPGPKPVSDEDAQCEDHFRRTHSRAQMVNTLFEFPSNTGPQFQLATLVCAPKNS